MQFKRFVLCAGLVAAVAGSSWAEVRLIGAEVAPFVYKEGEVAKGVAYELLREMAKRVGHSGKVEIVPFARALNIAETEADVLCFSIGRNPTREALFQWVTPLLDSA